jgi:hypothetical protein
LSRRAPYLFALALLLAASTLSAEPADETKRACANAYEQCQRLRQDGKLVEAREQAVRCAQTACPALLTTDCAHWVEELDQALPSIVVDARDESGKELHHVRVALDGRTLSENLEGVAFALNPGRHSFRFQAPGRAPVERDEVIVQGRKNQRLEVELRTENVAEAPTVSRRPSPWAYTTGSVAALGFVGFSYFGLIGNSRRRELDGSCKPRCTDAELSPMRRDYLVADSALAVGVVAAAATAILLLNGGTYERAPIAHPTHSAAPNVRKLYAQR